jgi:Lhr-like helicase
MDFNSEEIGWPHDTVIFQYNNPVSLVILVQRLERTGHVFVVNPKTYSIAMSHDAAVEIGVYDDNDA